MDVRCITIISTEQALVVIVYLYDSNFERVPITCVWLILLFGILVFSNIVL